MTGFELVAEWVKKIVGAYFYSLNRVGVKSGNPEIAIRQTVVGDIRSTSFF